MNRDSIEKKSGGGLSASFVTGAIALVFLIVGYQVAVFINRAAVSKIMSIRETPDTVFIVDDSAAARVLADAGNAALAAEGSAPGNSGVGISASCIVPSGHRGTVICKKGGHPSVVSSGSSSASESGKTGRMVENFRFNPNDVTVEDLVRLGFSEKQAMSIDSYRKKGGRFRRRSDFARSFVVSDSVYSRLEPYIDIPLLDLNAADSSAFDDLPGIGGYFASKMVAYREQLGGYSYKEQLMDIHRFDRDRYDALEDLVEIRPETCRPYPLWSLPEEQLRGHPYIGPYAAHGIVLYRENNPRSAWTVDALAAAGVLKADLAVKLSRCIIED
ncbi:MAG: helix-hairpin-helix domain-containing protein [Bacteroidales bacterium]|nr:helix-hairpin-helix domain-containing protein [Bacteroidales bacterium]